MKRIALTIFVLIAGFIAVDVLFPAQAAHSGLSLERWRNGLETKSIVVDGMNISYNEGGQGEALLLLHGFGADKDNWTRVAGHLTDQFHVFAIDLPGFGDSSRLPEAAFDIRSQTLRVHKIAEALGLQSFHIGGSSMGGFIALEYAGLYPLRLKSMWLLAPAGVDGAQPSELRAQYAKSGGNALIVEKAEDFPKIMQFTMSKPPFLPYSIKHQLGLRAERDHDELVRIFDAVSHSQPINDLLHNSPVPALIVWGEEDRALHVSATEVLDELLLNEHIIRRPGIGHLPMIEEPRRSALEFLEFQSNLAKNPV
ncbi:MAG: alpha/beta fold hydrolase [Oceanococcus sp.]